MIKLTMGVGDEVLRMYVEWEGDSGTNTLHGPRGFEVWKKKGKLRE